MSSLKRHFNSSQWIALSKCEFEYWICSIHPYLPNVDFSFVVRIVDKTERKIFPPHAHYEKATAIMKSSTAIHAIDKKFSCDLAFYFHTGRSYWVLNSCQKNDFT